MALMEYKIGPDGKKLSPNGKKMGRPPGAKGNLNAEIKDGIRFVWKQTKGRAGFLKWVKKDDKNYEKFLHWAMALIPKEILQTNTEKTEIHIINEQAQGVLNQLQEAIEKPKLVVNNE